MTTTTAAIIAANKRGVLWGVTGGKGRPPSPGYFGGIA